MFLIEEYMLKSIEERQLHLKLETGCIEIGGCSTNFRGLLSYYLQTTIPKGGKIHLCHACHNSGCSNPNHLYWGTAAENKNDADSNGGLTPWQHTINKYGLEKALEMQKRGDKSKGGKNNTGKKTEEHKQKISISLKGKKRGNYKTKETI